MKANITLNLPPEAAKTARTFFISQYEKLVAKGLEIQQEIESISDAIKAIDSQLLVSSNGDSQKKGKKSRRPYGSVAHSILEVFKGLPPATSLAMRDICVRAGTSWSSTYRILKTNPQFERVKGKKWRLKPTE
jgi:hypothetical protein